MSRERRREVVERQHTNLSKARQCTLVGSADRACTTGPRALVRNLDSRFTQDRRAHEEYKTEFSSRRLPHIRSQNPLASSRPSPGSQPSRSLNGSENNHCGSKQRHPKNPHLRQRCATSYPIQPFSFERCKQQASRSDDKYHEDSQVSSDPAA